MTKQVGHSLGFAVSKGLETRSLPVWAQTKLQFTAGSRSGRSCLPAGTCPGLRLPLAHPPPRFLPETLPCWKLSCKPRQRQASTPAAVTSTGRIRFPEMRSLSLSLSHACTHNGGAAHNAGHSGCRPCLAPTKGPVKPFLKNFAQGKKYIHPFARTRIHSLLSCSQRRGEWCFLLKKELVF